LVSDDRNGKRRFVPYLVWLSITHTLGQLVLVHAAFVTLQVVCNLKANVVLWFLTAIIKFCWFCLKTEKKSFENHKLTIIGN